VITQPAFDSAGNKTKTKVAAPADAAAVPVVLNVLAHFSALSVSVCLWVSLNLGHLGSQQGQP